MKSRCLNRLLRIIRFNSGIRYLNEVIDDPQHTLDLRRGFVLHRLMNLAETQRFQRIFLAPGFVNRAFYECNFYLTHCQLSVVGCWLLVIGGSSSAVKLITDNQ